ncbi:hypothetical protein SAY86_013225 [Trapa natans]|uniref:Uncharacterized protein n=1 Tax=Trapa natans TaxID=22666 RepID=A0AAN7MFF0_TRANT|nr:hypothetical protein SAY86_013225 [Trapa natans]
MGKGTRWPTRSSCICYMVGSGRMGRGSHHLGFDDTKNIAWVLQLTLLDGAEMKITAWKDPIFPNKCNKEVTSSSKVGSVLAIG